MSGIRDGENRREQFARRWKIILGTARSYLAAGYRSLRPKESDIVIQMHYSAMLELEILPMSTSNALIQTRIDPAIKEEAAAVLDAIGLTISDAVRILLTRTAKEGALPFELTHNPAAYDAWFRAKVQEALEDIRPAVPDDTVKARFAKRRATARRKAEGREP